ncbi:endoglucanase 10-like [Magnolia sinica]|uniref:endoglucanase 10-like n=1 Tax=Magnolia sinica TaxID=86752 RepID=UPI002658076D|nr:endoglucanase 10-like [Magnolia sinica]
MTVAEYENRFTELPRYTPLIQASKPMKMRRFSEGLRPEIRSKMCYASINNYAELFLVCMVLFITSLSSHFPLYVRIQIFLSPLHASTSTSMEENAVSYVHSISEANRLLPSASRWNSIEIDFGLHPESRSCDSLPSNYPKSVDCNLVIADKQAFKRFIYISVSLILIIITIILLLRFLPHKHSHDKSPKNLALALNQALLFFDAQKSGVLLENHTVKFRGVSGLQDGYSGKIHVDLVGGFYDSGNNVKFGFPTAYTITLLSWSVIEYHRKYTAMDELDHVRNIIKWGTDYLLKVFHPSNSTTDPAVLYSQVGSTSTNVVSDITCWERPEDMEYPRPVSMCKLASDLAGETAAALASASLVFKDEKAYSKELIQVAEELFAFATNEENLGRYTMDKDCGAEAQNFYNSSGYLDELVWGGTWLFFATGNDSYLRNATEMFESAMEAELTADTGVFYWNNKLPAAAVLLTRLRYLHDLGHPFEATLRSSSNMTDMIMCSYLSIHQNFNMTRGGLILLRPDHGGPLQFAAAAAFLSKLYKDYLGIIRSYGGSCGSQSFSLQMLNTFSTSQVQYILGNNPLKMSYLVGFGDHFPTQVHHRAASILWDDQYYSCAEGSRWLHSRDPNPNVLIGAMVAGPDQDDKFSDERDAPQYTEPSLSGNAGLVAALIALYDPTSPSSTSNEIDGGIDQMGIFANIM